MTTLLEQAFREVQKLPGELQDAIAQQLLDDIENEQKWQETFSEVDTDMGSFAAMAQAALDEDNAGETEEKGFGEV